MRRPEKLGDVAAGLVVAVLFTGPALLRAHFRLLSCVEVESYWRGTQGFLRDGPGTWQGPDGAFGAVLFPLGSLMSALVRLSTAVFGAHPLAIRSPALLASGLALALLWITLRARVGAVAASVGCVILETLPPAVRWMDFAGPQPLLLLSVFAGIACYLSSRQGRGKRRTVLVCLAATLLCPILGGFAGTIWLVTALALGVGGAFLAAWLPAMWRGLVFAAVCLCVVATAVADMKTLRRERHAYQSFVNSIEGAAAPGEEVRVDSPVTALPLDWYASPALRGRINWSTYGVVSPHHFAQAPFEAQEHAEFGESHELVVVGAEEKGLTWHWREAGYALTRIEATPDIELLYRGPSPMVRDGSRVFLVAPAADARQPQGDRIER